MENLIATLDFNLLFGGQEEKILFAYQLKQSLTTTGFFFLKNCQLVEEINIKKAEIIFKKFFEAPVETRMKYAFQEEGYECGYTPLRIETAVGAAQPDEKHFFHMREDRAIMVKEFPTLYQHGMRLCRDFQMTSKCLLEAVALSLDLPVDYFDQKEGNSTMRVAHYPANENPLDDDGLVVRGGNVAGMCAARHTDINMITLLLAREQGLQLWHEEEWIPITIDRPGLMIVNCGDMLEHLTGGRYISGIHRVVCQRNVERYSVPYFCHIKREESLVPLAHLGYSDLQAFPFETAGDFLDDRLGEIKLVAKN